MIHYLNSKNILIILSSILALTGCQETPYDVLKLSSEIVRGNIQQVRISIATGTDLNAIRADGWTHLATASYHGRTKIAELLIQSGADVNLKKGNFIHGDGRTPLMIASQRGHIEMVRLLLEEGADITIENPHNKTAIRLAEDAGRTDIVKIFKQHTVEHSTK